MTTHPLNRPFRRRSVDAPIAEGMAGAAEMEKEGLVPSVLPNLYTQSDLDQAYDDGYDDGFIEALANHGGEHGEEINPNLL